MHIHIHIRMHPDSCERVYTHALGGSNSRQHASQREKTRAAQPYLKHVCHVSCHPPAPAQGCHTRPRGARQAATRAGNGAAGSGSASVKFPPLALPSHTSSLADATPPRGHAEANLQPPPRRPWQSSQFPPGTAAAETPRPPELSPPEPPATPANRLRLQPLPRCLCVWRSDLVPQRLTLFIA
jgi:hypothetical protein